MCNLLFSLVFLLRIDHFPLQTCSGICREGDHLVVGPTDSGQFHKLTIGSIQRNRSACRVLRAGQAATLALGNFDRSLLRKVRSVWSSLILVPDHQVGLSVICTACFHLKGMVMVSPEMNPTICWRFEAEIVLLFHAKTFHKGFQVTVHIGNVRQTATVEAVYDTVSTSCKLQMLLSENVPLLLKLTFCYFFSTGGAEDRGESRGPI